MRQYEAQSKTGHRRALSRSGDIWNFGSGIQAITPVSKVNEEFYKEHGLTKYTRTKREGITPGHASTKGVLYRIYDPGAQILRCFQCHSTGPLSLTPEKGIQPFEMGVTCESCHGPGAAHAKSPGKTNIFQPKVLNGAGINEFCGNCHRQPPTAGQDTDFANPWNARHQPVTLSQSACFRKSNGKLTCFTCHDPHGARPTRIDACNDCHKPHNQPQPCVTCHMAPVRPSPDLQFANHQIKIYR